MANISAAMVKELRERTGLGMMECKKALVEAEGDIERAIDDLRKSSGMNNFLGFVNTVLEKAFASKATDVAELMAGELESAREALVQKIGENISVRRLMLVEGDVVDAYVHSNNRLAAVVALKGGNAEVARDVAMHVTAVNPRVTRPEDMPEDELQREKEIIMAQPDMEGKPQEIKEKMAGGRIKKFLAENSLVEQPFVKNPDQTVGQMTQAAGAEVVSFVRVAVGEGIEVEQKDFAAEVAEQLKK